MTRQTIRNMKNDKSRCMILTHALDDELDCKYLHGQPVGKHMLNSACEITTTYPR
jgi:hypothetical protein